MKFLAIFFMLVASVVNAGEYQQHEKEWMSALAPVMETAKVDNIPVSIFIARGEKYSPEFSQAYAFVDAENYGKTCNFVLNIADRESTNKLLGRFVAPSSTRVTALMTVWVHELGHCARYAKRDFTPFENMKDSTEEGFADVYALAWIHQNYPEMLDKAASFLISLRRSHQSSAIYSVEWAQKKDLIASSTGTPFEIATKIVFGK